MRLPAEETKTRLQFLRELFAAEPTLSVRKTQVRLQSKFGRTMRPKTILDVRAEVVREAEACATAGANGRNFR